jgi:5-methylthioadenosine/S-adenosylhomocysteine deaminase
MGMDEERWKKWESPFRQPVSRRALVRGAALTSAALRLGGFGLSARAAQAEPGPAPLTGTAPVLVRNAALVITMDPTLGEGPLGIISNGDVLFRGETLVAAGRGLSAPGATVLDASGKIVLPGFVDGHTHLVQSIYRGGCADQDLLGWLTNCKRPVSDALTPPDVYAAVRLSTLDTISTGVTTVVDWAGAWRPELAREYIRALADSGLRFVFAFAQPRQRADGIKRIKEELIDPNPRATLQVTGLPGMKNLELLTAMTEVARALDVMLNVHLLENIRQRDDGEFRSVQQAGALGPDLLVNHAIHLTDEEIGILGAHNVRATYNPLSNMRLASGIMRLPDLHKAGIKVALGLDGGTNDTSDMFSNMRAAVGLQRVQWLRADIFPTVHDVLRMATLGGAEVLDMGETIGSLTPGKKADVVILNPSGVNFAPCWDWVSQIVFNGQPANVEYVFVAGKPLKAAGQLVGVSPPEVVRAAESAAQRVRTALQR